MRAAKLFAIAVLALLAGIYLGQVMQGGWTP